MRSLKEWVVLISQNSEYTSWIHVSWIHASWIYAYRGHLHYGHICMGHTAWAPKGREGRSQGGPKGCRLEVGAQRASKLLAKKWWRAMLLDLPACLPKRFVTIRAMKTARPILFLIFLLPLTVALSEQLKMIWGTIIFHVLEMLHCSMYAERVITSWLYFVFWVYNWP